MWHSMGEKLRTCRLRKGMTLSAVAAAAGVSKAYLSQLENQLEERPSAAKLHALAAVLGVDMNFFVDDDIEPSHCQPAMDRAFVRDYQALPPAYKRYLRRVLDLLQRQTP